MNIHSIFSNRSPASDADSDDEDNRYVGGIGAHGGGSGLAVQPNRNNNNNNINSSSDFSDPSASIFAQAQRSSDPSPLSVAPIPSTAGAAPSRRRTITMYQSGFIVDDGPYRRLNDAANREFLTALAQGRVPRELASLEDNGEPTVAVEVGLIDKRTQEYVEPPPVFSSFSGAGESLGTAAVTTGSTAKDGVFHPANADTDTVLPPAIPTGEGSTSVQIRLLSGKRLVIKMNALETVQQLGQRFNASGMAGTESYVLVAGYPPKPITDLSLTIQSAGIAGASVQQKKL